jgi:hypothetical protein
MRNLALPVLIIFVAVSLISCGSYGNPSSYNGGTTPATVPVTVSVQDTPPAGVAILSFQIQITSATLQPSVATQAVVSLLVNPASVELEHLQSEAALLGSLNVAAGTYNSATVTFANPTMTIFNNTAAPLTVGATVCAVKTVCNLTPTLTSATVTVNTAPFPITLAANSPLGFLLHFDVNDSVNSNLLSITPTVDLKEIAPSATGVIHQENLTGMITAISAPDFTLQPGIGVPMPIPLGVAVATPPAFNIVTNSSTVYNFSDSLQATCTTNNFACLATGQTVNVIVNVLSNGTLVATQVTLFEQHNTPAFEGTVTSVDTAKSQFQMLLLSGQWLPGAPPSPNAAIGVLLTVSVSNTTAFEIDTDGITLPSGLTFAGISDMTPGQMVEIQIGPSAVSAGPAVNTLTLATSRVRLDESQVTATVTATNPTGTPPSFTLGTLPPLFGSASTINVLTVPTTLFVNVSGVAGLAVGDTVSAGGLLFNTAGAPTLVAEQVLSRVICPAVEASATTAGTTTIMVPCVLPPLP